MLPNTSAFTERPTHNNCRFQHRRRSRFSSESGELQHPHESDLFGSVMGPITETKMRVRTRIKVRIAITRPGRLQP